MAPKKKTALKNMSKKGVSPKTAAAVKGGKKRDPRIALNHNQTLRA